MNLNELLKGFDCVCGRRHTCPISFVEISKGCAANLARVFEKEKNVLVVADGNTFAAAGEGVMDALCSKNVRKIVFSGKKLLVPNEDSVAAVEKELAGIEAIVGIGSGVIQDLCKFVSLRSGIPYAIVATAPSMDGYASDGAAMILGGMKVTVKAVLPRAILADPGILKNAPEEMIRAGYGDVIGKFSALNDWKLAHAVTGEYFCPRIYDSVLAQVKEVASLADGLVRRDADAVAALTEALVAVGIMISFAGSSRPASGSEHHLSHFFEITGILDDKPYFAHGIDVGYSTVVTTRIREKLCEKPFPRVLYRDPAECEREVKRIYSTSAGGCFELQEKVGSYKRDLLPVYLAKEDELHKIFSDTPSAEEIEKTLARVGFDKKEFAAEYGEQKIREAVKWAKDLKDRYTVLWVNYDLYKGEL
ncbi:MAG: sn-glycerol-1-phosphate dehydrogenase [Clostridia bacterium]|nr:sn-glycerol-1-phosphate dehydrogenase [Clostridia bacterium]